MGHCQRQCTQLFFPLRCVTGAPPQVTLELAGVLEALALLTKRRLRVWATSPRFE